MINKLAVAKFLKRKLDSFNWMKREAAADIDAALNELSPQPDFGTIKLWLHQKVCFLILVTLKRFKLYVDMGGGKALPVDEPVLTPKGWVPIGSLKVGDKVIGVNGKPTSVTGVFPQGVKKVFRATFSDGAAVRCCEDHLWAVNTPTRNWAGKKHHIKALKNIEPIRDTNGWRQRFVPLVKPIDFDFKPYLRINPYLLGLWIGDGCRKVPLITTMDEEIVEAIKTLKHPAVTVRTRGPNPGCLAADYRMSVMRWGVNPFSRDLKFYGLWEKYSYQRFIPKDYLFAPVPDRIALLQGLMDTDGYVDVDGHCSYDTSSPWLAKDFVDLARSLGATATCNFRENAHKGHYNIYLNFPVGVSPFRLTRKLERYTSSVKSKKPPTRAFDSIHPEGEDECVCISVAAEDGLFVAKDFVVTHNTLLTLSLLKYRKQCGHKPKAIVFVPYITSVETWVEETQKHTPELTCVPLLGSGAENLAALKQPGDLFVACYQSAVAMITEKVYNPKKRKTEWKLSAAQVREHFSGFDMLVMDEIHKCASVDTLTYRMCRAISSQCEYVLGLTGTPFGRNPIALWPQFYLIDFGETLGPTLNFYREVFFTSKPKPFGGYDHKFKQKMLPDLKRMVRNSSIAYTIDEFTDMPERSYVKRHIAAPAASKAYIELAAKNIKANAGMGGKDRYQIIESNYLQLRQLSSGYMTLKGQDTDRLHIKFAENPKLDMLESIIDSMPSDSKAVVFHHFQYTNQLISERLKAMGVGHARIWGKCRDPIEQLRHFKNDDKCKVLVINSRSGSSSLNLQIANFVVFFEQPDTPIDRQQAERRTWRPGQLKRVFYYDLFVKGTYDYRQWTANKAGEDLLKQVITGG